MIGHPFKPLILLFLLVLTGACYTSRIPLSVLKPASITLPGAVSRVSIFPVAGYIANVNQFDSISQISLDPKIDANQIRSGYLDGMYEVLTRSPAFEKVVYSDSSFGKFMVEGRLYWEDLRTICRKDTTDVILLLKKAVTYDTKLGREFYSDKEYFAIYKLLNHTVWTIYDPFRQVELIELNETDSLQLEGYFSDHSDPHLLYKACYTSGYLNGLKISPYWKDTTRTYFTGPGRNLHKAARLLKRDEWSQAASIWNDLSDGPNRALASKAAFNMALAWEHDDVLDQSILWIEYADSLRDSKYILQYRKVLEKRLAENEKLDRQIHRR
jgi:hypothetical protein